MHATNPRFALPFLAAALIACGSSRSHNPPHPSRTGGAGGMATAGSPPSSDGGAVDHGGEGTGLIDEAGAAGTTARGGSGGTDTGGDGAGEPSSGGLSAAGKTATAGSGIGGATSGGAPAGGATSGGMPATGGARGVEIALPANCTASSQSADAQTCAVAYSCGAQTHFDDCRLDSNGVWQCECGSFSSITRYFEVEDMEAPAACSLIAKVCESDVTKSPTRTCAIQEPTADSGSCTAQATCGYALDVGAGVVAREVERYSSSCSPTVYTNFADGGFDCQCHGGALDRNGYLTHSSSLRTVCAPMLDFCTAETDPVYTGRTCGDAAPYGVVEQDCPANQNCQGCVMYQQCAATATITPDLSILSQDSTPYQEIVCRRRPQSDIRCRCNVGIDAVYGDDTVPQSVLDVCRNNANVCGP